MTEDQTTFYMVMFRCKGEIRSQQAEGQVPETEAEVLKMIEDAEGTYEVGRIIRCDYDVPPRDVTDDVRDTMFANWMDNNDPDLNEPPSFIRELVENRDEANTPDADYQRDMRADERNAA